MELRAGKIVYQRERLPRLVAAGFDFELTKTIRQAEVN